MRNLFFNFVNLFSLNLAGQTKAVGFEEENEAATGNSETSLAARIASNVSCPDNVDNLKRRLHWRGVVGENAGEIEGAATIGETTLSLKGFFVTLNINHTECCVLFNFTLNVVLLRVAGTK